MAALLSQGAQSRCSTAQTCPRQQCCQALANRALCTRTLFFGSRSRARSSLVLACTSKTAGDANGTVTLEKTGPSWKAAKDIDSIMKTLPHRFPFLLVDRVIECEFEKYAVGYKNVTVNDNFFTGHFPDRPIMPGVLQVEAMAQLGGLIMLSPESVAQKQLFFFGGIDGCKFRKPVVPGDTLMMRVTVTKNNKRFGIVKMDAKGYVGADLAVEAELTLVMAKSP